jgi:hypothetical protein
VKESIRHFSLSFTAAGWRGLSLVLWLAVLVAHFPGVTRAAELPPDGSIPIRAIQDIASRDPFTETKIKVRGVVTWVDATVGRSFYIQDATGGVRVGSGTKAVPELGDEVFVGGGTQPHSRFDAPRFRRLPA